MHKPKRNQIERDTKVLTSEELRQVSAGQIIDKYNQTVKAIDSLRQVIDN